MSRGFLVARYGFYAAMIAMLAWFGALHLLLMYWIVPLFTWLIVIFRIRSIAEHSAIEGRANAYAQTRSTRASVLEHVFVAPKNVNYHIEHHFYPSVPFYRLPELHRVLMSKAEFKDSVHVTRSYFGVLRECLGEAHSSAAGLGKSSGCVRAARKPDRGLRQLCSELRSGGGLSESAAAGRRRLSRAELCRPRFGKDAQKILRVESIANRVGTSAERGLEARDRIAAAFGVRIVGREQVQVGVGLIDQERQPPRTQTA